MSLYFLYGSILHPCIKQMFTAIQTLNRALCVRRGFNTFLKEILQNTPHP
jgi:hypothetical protein